MLQLVAVAKFWQLLDILPPFAVVPKKSAVMHNYAVVKSRKNKPFLVVLAVRVRVGFVYLCTAKSHEK